MTRTELNIPTKDTVYGAIGNEALSFPVSSDYKGHWMRLELGSALTWVEVTSGFQKMGQNPALTQGFPNQIELIHI